MIEIAGNTRYNRFDLRAVMRKVIACYDREPVSHGMNAAQSQLARQDKYITRMEQLSQLSFIVTFADEHDMRLQVQLITQRHKGVTFRPSAYENRIDGIARPHQRTLGTQNPVRQFTGSKPA